MEVKLNHISKKLKSTVILDQINLEFRSGVIYGIHGRNGSGKTMLLRMIAGLIHLSEGEVVIDGKVLHKDIDFPQSVGVMIETPDFWKNYTGKKVLLTLASIKKVIGIKEIEEVLVRVGLDPKDRRSIRKYSLGMRQRLGIAQAIMEHPDLLLLDEPTNALDKSGVFMAEKIFREEAERGAIVIIASHNMQDLEMCDCLIEMDAGKIYSMEGI